MTLPIPLHLFRANSHLSRSTARSRAVPLPIKALAPCASASRFQRKSKSEDVPVPEHPRHKSHSTGAPIQQSLLSIRHCTSHVSSQTLPVRIGPNARWECAAYIEWVSFHWLHAHASKKGRSVRRQNRKRHLWANRYNRSGYHLQPASREYSFRCWGALYPIRSVAPCAGKY